jgi:putative flavoprotein involved in K+ transport
MLNLSFVILDARDRVGDAWRRRWDSLRLFTPARLNGLPGMSFPAAPNSTVTKDQMADYLEAYTKQFQIPIRLRTFAETLSLERGRFLVRTGQLAFEADQVVVATGGHPVLSRPAFSAELDPDILQLHSADYRSPSQLDTGDVLIVGAGNSGAEIAMEAATSHRTWLAGQSTGIFSAALYARPLWWVLKRISNVQTPSGRRLKERSLGRGTPLVRLRAKDFAAASVVRTDRVVGVSEGLPQLGDVRVLDVKNVIWCTGFTHDFSWIQLPCVENGHIPLHDRGVVEAQPGLYFVGLPFQSHLASALIDGVGRDAEYVSRHILAASAGQRRVTSSARVSPIQGG